MCLWGGGGGGGGGEVVEKTLLLSSDCTKQSNFTNPISDGTLLAPESDNTQLHALFGQTWKVRNESDWLFRHTLSLVESDLEEGPVNAVYEVPPEFAASVNQVGLFSNPPSSPPPPPPLHTHTNTQTHTHTHTHTHTFPTFIVHFFLLNKKIHEKRQNFS